MRPIAFSVPFGKSTLIPGGCLHWPIGEKDLLREWVRSVAEAENGFTILMGDSLDCARTHYRDYIRGYRQDENSQMALDEWIKRDVEALARELRPIAKRIIGVILGNHFWEFSDGTNSEQYLARLLEVPYLGPMGVVRLEFRTQNSNDSRVRHQMTLYAHHSGGGNGGRTTGADIGALERQELSFDADIYCLSHTHRRGGFKTPQLALNRKGQPRLTERTRVFLRTGAFLKGFGEDHPGTDRQHVPTYAEKKALRPTDLGWVSLHIKLSNVNLKGKRGVPGNEVRSEFTIAY